MKCTKCGEDKELTEFPKSKRTKSGVTNPCKECGRRYSKRRYETDPAAKIAKVTEYNQSATGREKAKIWRDENRERFKGYEANRDKSSRGVSRRDYNARHPQKYAARNITSNAIRAGKLIKQPCLICRSETSIQAHHDDYSKPLVVTWLCNDHHKAWHRVFKPNF